VAAETGGIAVSIKSSPGRQGVVMKWLGSDEEVSWITVGVTRSRDSPHTPARLCYQLPTGAQQITAAYLVSCEDGRPEVRLPGVQYKIRGSRPSPEGAGTGVTHSKSSDREATLPFSGGLAPGELDTVRLLRGLHRRA